jgi:hypothetical protein
MRDPVLDRVGSITSQTVNRASWAGDPELAEGSRSCPSWPMRVSGPKKP